MKTVKKYVLLVIPLISLASLSGCAVAVRPPGPVVVEPGYYYDDGFWDGYHVWHPRAYYYYDRGHWDPRPFAPRGFAVRPRFRR